MHEGGCGLGGDLTIPKGNVPPHFPHQKVTTTEGLIYTMPEEH